MRPSPTTRHLPAHCAKGRTGGVGVRPLWCVAWKMSCNEPESTTSSLLAWSGAPVVRWKTTAAERGSARKEERWQIVSKGCSGGMSEKISATLHLVSWKGGPDMDRVHNGREWRMQPSHAPVPRTGPPQDPMQYTWMSDDQGCETARWASSRSASLGLSVRAPVVYKKGGTAVRRCKGSSDHTCFSTRALPYNVRQCASPTLTIPLVLRSLQRLWRHIGRRSSCKGQFQAELVLPSWSTCGISG